MSALQFVTEFLRKRSSLCHQAPQLVTCCEVAVSLSLYSLIETRGDMKMSLRGMGPRPPKPRITFNLMNVGVVGLNPPQDWNVFLFCVCLVREKVWRSKCRSVSVAIGFKNCAGVRVTFFCNWWTYCSMPFNVGGQPDMRRQPRFGTQFVQNPCVYLSRRTYGSNTAHCLRERDQRLLLTTQGNAAGWKPTDALTVFQVCYNICAEYRLLILERQLARAASVTWASRVVTPLWNELRSSWKSVIK